MSMQQIFSVIGITSGYVVGSIATDWEGTWVEEYFDWHTAFASQGFAMCVIGLCFCCFNNKNIDILRTGELEMEIEDEGAGKGDMSSPRNALSYKSQEEIEKEYSFLDQIPLLHEVKVLLTNKMYMLITGTITVLFFSATGLQFWTLSYFIQILHVKPINPAFFLQMALQRPTEGRHTLRRPLTYPEILVLRLLFI